MIFTICTYILTYSIKDKRKITDIRFSNILCVYSFDNLCGRGLLNILAMIVCE